MNEGALDWESRNHETVVMLVVGDINFYAPFCSENLKGLEMD